MDAPQQLGYYGKIPSKGDFISHHLPRLFIDPWDQWLQECLVSSRDQLCEQWLDSYLVSPIWRFALSAGICSENAWVGILMPSVDKVGRYFPLTLVMPVNTSQPLLNITEIEEQWFASAEQLALSALNQNNELTEFNQKIDDLGIPTSLNNNTAQKRAITHIHTQQYPWRITTEGHSSINGQLNSLLQFLLQDKFPRLSIWWTHGSEQIQPTLLVSNDLPAAHKFHTLLTGEKESSAELLV